METERTTRKPPADPVEPLILDLLEALASRPRSYAEVMDAWRTSCPRLPVWEEANARRLVSGRRQGREVVIELSARGRAWLDLHRARPGRSAGLRLPDDLRDMG